MNLMLYLLASTVFWSGFAAGASLPSREEVLAAVFAKASVRAERVFLTKEQCDRIARIADAKVPSALIARYTVTRDGLTVGRAYVDTHIVRSKQESLLVCLDQQGRVVRVEITAFDEPPEYQAPEAWYGQYKGKQLDDDLRLERSIRPLAGATLTARAANEAVRRVLATDKVLAEETE